MPDVIRIALSADDDNGLESVVSPHFGRCPYFVLVDMEGHQVKAVQAIANPSFGHHEPGEVPGFIHSHGANVMLTGGMGQRAIMFFQQYGIHAATGASGTVRRALEQFLGGGLQDAEPCSVSQSHAVQEAEEAAGVYEQDAVGRLREEVEMLQQQLDEALARLNVLAS